MNLEKIANNISLALKEWFEETGKTETTPEEIMPYLFEKGIYKKGNRKDVLQLRKDLRKLDDEGRLNLIEGAYWVPNGKIRNWYLKKR